MTEYIKKQLKKCNFAQIPEIDSTTTSCIIKKYTKPQYKAGSCYLVRIAQEFIKNLNLPIASN